MVEFNYPLWLNQAFLGILKNSLKVASEYGSLEENSLYITFKVNAKGVQLSKPMQARFPEEIMIVIQNEYWNITVNEDNFSVDLSFNGVLETVIVPYKAIVSFSDPEFKIGYEFIDDELLSLDTDDDSENTHSENIHSENIHSENIHSENGKSDDNPNAYDEDVISKTLTDILSKKSPFEKNHKPKKKAKIVQINKK